MKKIILTTILFLAFAYSCMAQVDKLNHLIYGVAISSVAYTFAPKKHRFWMSIAAPVLAGALKEYIDSRTHNPEFLDFAATAGGGIVMSVGLKIRFK